MANFLWNLDHWYLDTWWGLYLSGYVFQGFPDKVSIWIETEESRVPWPMQRASSQIRAEAEDKKRQRSGAGLFSPDLDWEWVSWPSTRAYRTGLSHSHWLLWVSSLLTANCGTSPEASSSGEISYMPLALSPEDVGAHAAWTRGRPACDIILRGAKPALASWSKTFKNTWCTYWFPLIG